MRLIYFLYGATVTALVSAGALALAYPLAGAAVAAVAMVGHTVAVLLDGRYQAGTEHRWAAEVAARRVQHCPRCQARLRRNRWYDSADSWGLYWSELPERDRRELTQREFDRDPEYYDQLP